MLRGAVVLWALLSCTNACAQVSGSATVLSDYRFRGVSLSDGQPAAQLGVAWERDDGWYAGAFASSTRLYGRPGTQLLAYLGYAHRLHDGPSWEAGAEYAAFSRYPGDSYPEFYLGLASDKLSGRLYWAPSGAGVSDSQKLERPNLGNPGYDVLSYDLALTYSGRNDQPLQAVTTLDAERIAGGKQHRADIEGAVVLFGNPVAIELDER